MKIPERFGFLINYHAGDNLDGLKHSINHKAQSALVRLWIKVMQKIPVLGRYLAIGHKECLCKNQRVESFDIQVGDDRKPYLRPINNSMRQECDLHLLPVPHSQQISPNGCVDACLDMLGCHFRCDSLRAPVTFRSDGLRRMPETERPLLEGLGKIEFHEKLNEARLELKSIKHDKLAIKNALRGGPILATIIFAFGFYEHLVLIVGYHGDQVIINDPWHGGHIKRSMNSLLRSLSHKEDAPLALVTRK